MVRKRNISFEKIRMPSDSRTVRIPPSNTMSDPYAHRCCKAAGIKSKTKRYSYKKPGNRYRLYSNLLLAGLPISGPMQCAVSDMTAFNYQGTHYELTLYMGLWNNEIISYGLYRQDAATG